MNGFISIMVCSIIKEAFVFSQEHSSSSAIINVVTFHSTLIINIIEKFLSKEALLSKKTATIC